jgi:hypothetical protein
MTEVRAMIASVSAIPVRVIKILHSSYEVPDPLPWAAVALSFNPQHRSSCR